LDRASDKSKAFLRLLSEPVTPGQLLRQTTPPT